MKVKLSSLNLLIILILALGLMAFTPVAGIQDPGPELTEAQIYIAGLVASTVIWILRALAARNYHPPKEVVTIGLYVVAFFLAVGFSAVTIPPFPPFADPPGAVAAFFAWVSDLIMLAAPLVGIAYAIYNLILKRVLEQVFPQASASIQIKG